MTALETIITDLLLRHNCVVIPGFGGFVAKTAPASIDMDRGLITPPHKSILFNKHLINNDGLLITELARREHFSYAEAERKVNEVTQNWQGVLRQTNRLELDRLGFFYYNNEGNLCFEQDRFVNLLLASFGLTHVSFVPEQVQKLPVLNVEPLGENKETTENKVELKIVRSTPGQKTSRKKIIRYVAAACLLPLAFYSFWIPTQTTVLQSGMISLQDFNPFRKSEQVSYQRIETQTGVKSPETSSTLTEEDGTLVLKVDDDLHVPVRTEKADVETLDSEASFHAEAMHLIVGCFGSEANATNLVKKLKGEGFEARIVDFTNGLHRVSAGSALSDQALQQIQSDLSSSGYKTWILK